MALTVQSDSTISCAHSRTHAASQQIMLMVYTSKTQRKKEKLGVEIQMTMSRSQTAADYDALVDKDTAQHALSL